MNWNALQQIDRRILYLLLAFVIGAPFVFNIPVPPAIVLPQTRQFYDTLEKIADDPIENKKLILLSANYGGGTLAENQSQTEAVMRHMMKHKLHFAILCFNDPQGRQLGQNVADKLAPKYGYQYGRDYVNWGYRPADAIVPILKTAVRDIPGAFVNDYNGTPLTSIPVMQNIKTVDDVGAIIEVASANTIDPWLQYYQRTGKEPVPTLFCPTGVMAPEAFPYLKSGQLQGMLSGLNGAIEYERLLGEPGFATRASASLSYAHLLIIALIVLGNVGMVLARRQAVGGGR